MLKLTPKQIEAIIAAAIVFVVICATLYIVYTPPPGP